MTLGEKIKELRSISRMTQEELAEKLNVSRSAVAKWESNNGIPDIINLRKIARTFSVSIDSLVDYAVDLRIKESNGVEKVSLSKYVGEFCDIELVGWNDGVYHSYVINEDLNFFFYMRQSKKKSIYGCLVKKWIKEISINESQENVVLKNAKTTGLDYFIGKQVNIELVKERGIKGFFDFRDDDLMGVKIKSFESDSLVLEFGREIDYSEICKIEEV